MKRHKRCPDPIPRFSLFVLMLLLLQSCATALNRRLDQKLALESGITTQKDLEKEATHWIQESNSLTADQRQRLDSLKDRTSARMNELKETSLKLRSVLISDLLNGGSQDEVKLIQSRLSELEHRRLDLILQTTARAGDILGRTAINQEWIDQALFIPHGGGN